MIFLLCILLRPALLGHEQKRKYWYLLPITIVVAILDIIVRNTTWKLISGPLLPKEVTISQSLHRLVRTPGPRQQLFIEISKEINRQSPSGKHINLENL